VSRNEQRLWTHRGGCGDSCPQLRRCWLRTCAIPDGAAAPQRFAPTTSRRARCRRPLCCGSDKDLQRL